MNRTDTLLRLKRFRVDEMKRRIASIDAMKADLERKLTDLDDNVTREKQRAGDSDIGRLAFPSFLRSIEARRENLRTTLKEIEREYAAAQQDLTDAFHDLKSLQCRADASGHSQGLCAVSAAGYRRRDSPDGRSHDLQSRLYVLSYSAGALRDFRTEGGGRPPAGSLP